MYSASRLLETSARLAKLTGALIDAPSSGNAVIGAVVAPEGWMPIEVMPTLVAVSLSLFTNRTCSVAAVPSAICDRVDADIRTVESNAWW